MANKKVQQLTAVENEQNDKSKINWKVRIKNKAFWLALIPAVLLLIQVIASVSVTPLTWATWVISYFPSSKPCLWFFLFLVSW